MQSQENQTPINQVIPIRYCLYARKSTEQDELQALSIDSQIKEMLDMANAENIEVIEIRKESHSAKIWYAYLFLFWVENLHPAVVSVSYVTSTTTAYYQLFMYITVNQIFNFFGDIMLSLTG